MYFEGRQVFEGRTIGFLVFHVFLCKRKHLYKLANVQQKVILTPLDIKIHLIKKKKKKRKGRRGKIFSESGYQCVCVGGRVTRKGRMWCFASTYENKRNLLKIGLRRRRGE
jgi:hypothetical protein